MAEDLATLTTQRDRLRDIRAKGIDTYTIGQRTVKYRSDADVARALAEVERKIAALAFMPVRTIHILSTKGT